ncbi:RHS repeat-associated core domain-containing protein [Methanobrevibacter sp.]
MVCLLKLIAQGCTGDGSVCCYPATNRRGDVVAIYNSVGNCIVKYEYDAWGNVIAVVDDSGINLAEINPIRYRGYYYDAETKLYYLQSRYYNPEVGRFLNADGFITTDIDEPLTYNMFAYCMNNPVKGA